MKTKARTRLRTRFLASAVFVMLMLVLTNGLLYRDLHEVGGAVGDVNVAAERALYAKEIQIAVARMELSLRYVVDWDEALDEAAMHHEAAAGIIALLGASVHDAEQRTRIETLSRGLESFMSEARELVETHGGIDLDVLEDYFDELDELSTELAFLTEELSYAYVGDMRGHSDHSRGRLETVQLRSVALSACLAAIVAIGLFAAYRRLVRPISRTSSALRAVESQLDAGQADLTLRLDESTDDEFADMARSFNALFDRLGSIVLEVAQAARELAVASEQMSRQASSAQDCVSQQSQRTDRIATAIDEMTASIRSVAEFASDASDATQRADRETRDGRDVISRTMDAIKALSSEVGRAEEVVHSVESESANISQVVHVITEIANQINILAINSSIEAAHAGEHGKGFAVVANEVRSLAERTQESTVKIQDIVERLQARAQEASRMMHESRSGAEATVDRVSSAWSALESITGSVDTINRLSAEIASAAKEQSSVASDINGSVHQINGLAKESARGSAETVQCSGQLASLTTRLQQQVRPFRLEDGLAAQPG